MPVLYKFCKFYQRDCKPIIVTDAGFKTPWFRSVLAQGSDFVSRTRLPNFYSVDGECWQCITHLYRKATQHAQAFIGCIARSNPLKCQLVVYKQKAKGRKALNRSGKPKQSKHAKVHIKSARDPWLISSSLPYSRNSATKLVKIYQLRMQIEEGFRDMKSRRFGQGFTYNKATIQSRLSLLVLLTTLAHWFLMILGMTVKLENKHRQYQANSLKTGNILSLQFIGQRVAVDKGVRLYMRSCLNAIKQLQNVGAENDY
ncbi:IS4 family transposase [Pseudoalteromonas sp. JBTF-M23]|uniref:IS4 family transposase n=1 Tax=Pseudoalteromonas caenipelagi TaxID=2726988 RepID=A0A849V8J2_9GAMM|nr:IS4 family transposase [Pseudoalteromonas caenipelagi]